MPKPRHLLLVTSALVCSSLLQGCTVLAIADTVGSIAVKGVGMAADVAIGTVKTTGKVVGAAADLVIPDGDDKK